MSQIGDKVGGIEAALLFFDGLFREESRWQSFSACICTFPYLLSAAFWFKLSLHAVILYTATLIQDGLCGCN